MQFERLKKSHKKQIAIGALAVCIIGGALTFNLTKAKYKVTDSVPLVTGTINYTVPDMKVVAVKLSEDGTNYTDTNEIPTSGYTLNSEKSICKVYDGTTSIQEAPKDNNVTIEYNNGEINIRHLTKKNTRCYVYFDKKTSIDNVTELLAKIKNEAKTTAPDFSTIADTDEGTYAVKDVMYGGTSYYWRGAVTNNYVQFAGFCWRIVRINGDESIRIIYDGAICHENGKSTTESIAVLNQTYNLGCEESYLVGWTYTSSQRPSTSVPQTSGTASNAKTQIENWLNTNIKTSSLEKVINGKFCNERNVKTGQVWESTNPLDYMVKTRIVDNKLPSLSCSNGDIYELTIGLITADEIFYAGGLYGIENNKFYLYNGQNYWTMTPSGYYSLLSSSPYANVFLLKSGVLSSVSVGDNYFEANKYGLRPVINLKSDVTFSSGDGTLNNPYVVAD